MMRRLLAIAGLVSLAFSLVWFPGTAQEKAADPEIVARLKGHTDAVYAIAYSPDGKTLATASFDNTLRLWDAATGKELKTYGGTTGHTKQVISIAFSPDGAMLASGATDNTLKVWDVPINAPIRSLKSNDAVEAVALTPDGKKLALGGKDGLIRLVTPEEFKELIKFEPGHKGAITGLAFSANGQQLASVGVDRTLRYWNVLTGKLLATIGAHTVGVNAVAVNANNTAAYTVGADGFLKFWQATPPAPEKTVIGHAAAIRALTLSVNNANYFTGSDDKSVREVIIATAKETRAYLGASAGITSIAAHPANAFVAAGLADGQVFLWKTSDGKIVTNWLAHTGAVHSAGMVAPGQQLMTTGADGLVKVWAVPPAPVRLVTHPAAVLAARTSPDGKKMYTGAEDKIVRIWDSAKQTLEKQFTGHDAPVTTVAVSANLQLLASGSADKTIRIWNQATAKEANILLGHTAPLTSLAVNPAGTQMLSASEDGAVKVWTLPVVTPKSLIHPGPLGQLILTPDGAKVLTAGSDKILRLWNATSGAKERDYAAVAQPITNVAISGNGALLAAASAADKTVTIWALNTPAPTKKLPLPAAPQAVAFASDAQSVFVGLADGKITQIKIADGKEIKAFPAQHQGAIADLALSPKGDLLFSASADKSIQIWTLPAGTPKGKLVHVGPIKALALSKDGTRAAAVGDKVVKVWTPADGKEVGTFKVPADASAISLSPDNTRVIVGCDDKLARVYGLDGQMIEMFPHDGPVSGVAFVDAKRIATGGADKQARIWTTSVLWQRQHQGAVRDATFTPKGDQVISAGDDKAIKIWNATDGKEFKSLAADGPISHLSLSGDATKLMSAHPGVDKGPGPRVKIWTLADGKNSATIPVPDKHLSFAFSPNGQRLALAGSDGPKHAIRIHDIALGKEVQRFEDHTGPVNSLQFLADGRTLVTGSADKTARLLDVNVLSALPAHPAGPTFAQYNANGTQLLTAGADKTVKLWDVAKSAVLKTFGPVTEPISAIAFSRDFTKVGAAAGKTVKVWTVADGKEIATLSHAVDVLALNFNQDGTRIATGAADKETRLWEIASGKELQFFAQEDAVAAVVHLPNNTLISAAGKATHIEAPAALRLIVADKGPTEALTIVPANTHVLTGGADKVVKLWNLTNGAKEREFVGAGGPVKAVAIAKNALLLAAGGVDGVLRIHQFADAKEIGSLKLTGEVRSLSFTPNSVAVVASTAGKTLGAWSTPFVNGQPLAKEFLAPIQSFTAKDLLADFTIAADNASIYSAGQDNAMHVWKLASATPTRNFAHPGNVDAVAFQPAGDGKGQPVLVSACHDGKIRFFDLVKNAQAKDINAHIRTVAKNNVPHPIYSLTFSPDGKQLLSTSFDNSIKLWNTSTFALVKEFAPHKVKDFERGHQEPVFSAALSPDGKFIASGSSGLERIIKIWSLDGKVVRDLDNPAYKGSPGFPAPSQPGSVTGLRFTKNGKYLISIGDAPANKGYLAIWDWQANKLVYERTLQLGVFYNLALAPDEKNLAIAAGNRDRKFASPENNSGYVLKMPLLK
ncbi:MAG: WD40 repeat domain-containing protein [Planctomycetes bacterium]|nr:WD40 repeat domain-containing protein [Planctomycetota bacterium]